MRAHLAYARYVLRHKAYVLRSGLWVGPPAPGALGWLAWLWRLLVHDLSKLRPSEWRPYADYFYGEPVAGCKPCQERREARFNAAWLKHLHRNDHHWQHWLLMEDDAGPAKWTLRGSAVEFAALPDSSYATALKKYVVGHADGFEMLSLHGGDVSYFRTLVQDANARCPTALPMPAATVHEMVADWVGAGWALHGEPLQVLEWWRTHRDGIVLHPDTLEMVEDLLASPRWLTKAVAHPSNKAVSA